MARRGPGNVTAAGVAALCVGLAAVAAWLGVCGSAYGQEAEADWVQAVREREARIGSCQYEWTWEKESWKVLPGGRTRKRRPRGGDESYREHGQSRVVFCDGKVRFEEERHELGPDERPFDWRTTEVLTPSDGSRGLTARGRDMDLGVVSGRCYVAGRFRRMPVLVAHRLFDADWGVLPQESQVVGRVTWQERPCLVVERHDPRSEQLVRHVWLAEDQDYAVVRMQHPRGTLGADMEFDYAADEEVGWRLSSWTETYRTGGSLEKYTSRVVSFELNGAVPDETFEWEFPAGTYVSDLLTGEEYVMGRGEPMSERQERKHLAKLAREMYPEPGRGGWKWAAGGGGIVLIGVVAAGAYLRRRRLRPGRA
jgi:hypothetical protein